MTSGRALIRTHCLLLLSLFLAPGAGPPAPRLEDDKISAFFKRHTRLLRERRFAELQALYSPDFCSSDFQADRARMMTIWERLADSTVVDSAPMVCSTAQARGFHAVTTCQEVKSRRTTNADGGDIWCLTYVLDAKDQEPRIVSIYEADEDKLARIDAEQRIYRAEPLSYELRWPDGLLPIPCSSSTFVDRLVLLDPARGAQISLTLFDPSLIGSTEQLLRLDLRSSRCVDCSFLSAPEAFAVEPGWSATLAELELEDPGPEQESGRCGVGHYLGCIYSSPDGRSLFAAELTAPEDTYLAARGGWLEVARSIRLLESENRDEPLISRLLRGDPSGQAVHGSKYDDARMPVTIDIPPGWSVEPLLRTLLTEVRLRPSREDSTILLLRCYPPHSQIDDPEQMLERAAEHVCRAFCCREYLKKNPQIFAKGPLSLPFSGSQATRLSIDVQCDNGVRQRHVLIGWTQGDFRMQLQLVPGNDGARSVRWLEEILPAIHPRD